METLRRRKLCLPPYSSLHPKRSGDGIRPVIEELMTVMTVRMILRALPLLALFTASAFAGPLTIDFTASLLTALDGQTVTFAGSITNSSGTAVFLNGDSL